MIVPKVTQLKILTDVELKNVRILCPVELGMQAQIG